jgi:hypothetical protein
MLFSFAAATTISVFVDVHAKLEAISASRAVLNIWTDIWRALHCGQAAINAWKA